MSPDDVNDICRIYANNSVKVMCRVPGILLIHSSVIAELISFIIFLFSVVGGNETCLIATEFYSKTVDFAIIFCVLCLP